MKDILIATIPATIPTLTVLIALLVNQVSISRLASEIVDLHKQLNGEITGLRKEHHDDITALRQQLHNDIVMLAGRDTDKSERLARLEERSKG